MIKVFQNRFLDSLKSKSGLDLAGGCEPVPMPFAAPVFEYEKRSKFIHSLHEVEERLARWLLTAQDRVGNPELPLTQQFLGDMLGARRFHGHHHGRKFAALWNYRIPPRPHPD